MSKPRPKGGTLHRRPGLRTAIEAMLRAGCNGNEIARVLGCSAEYARDVQSEIMPNFNPPSAPSAKSSPASHPTPAPSWTTS